MYCRVDTENYKIRFENDTITLSSRKILWPDKLLKIFKELERFGYSVKIIAESSVLRSKKINLEEFEKFLEDQEYKEDYVIFEAKPKGIKRLLNRSLVSGYASYMFLGVEVFNKNSCEFTIKGKDSIKLLGIIGKYIVEDLVLNFKYYTNF